MRHRKKQTKQHFAISNGLYFNFTPHVLFFNFISLNIIFLATRCRAVILAGSLVSQVNSLIIILK